MKTIPLFAIMLLLLVTSVFAQPNRTITMEFTYPTDGYPKVRDVVTFPNDDAIMLYVTRNNSPDVVSLWAIRINAAGEGIWNQLIYQAPEDYHILSSHLTTLPDNGIAVAWSVNRTHRSGSPINWVQTARLSSTGQLEWMHFGGENVYRMNKAVLGIDYLEGDSLIIVARKANVDRTMADIVITLDLDGTLLNAIGTDTVIRDLPKVLINENGVVFAEAEYIYQMNYHGEMLWNAYTSFQYTTYDISERFDGTFCMTGLNNNQQAYEIRVVAVDAQDGELWHTEIEPERRNPDSQVLALQNDMVLVREKEGTLHLLNQNGDLVWSSRDTNIYSFRTDKAPPMTMFDNGDVLLGHKSDAISIGMVRVTPDQYPDYGDRTAGAAEGTVSAKTFEILPAYPNPFNASTTVQLQMPSAGELGITITDVLGRQVDSWSVSTMKAGLFPVSWTPDHLAGGTYFLRAQTEYGETEIQKIVFLP
jgi:Secretion system C-terminal sorting domain